MDLLDMPVRLVVKAPNQKVADHTVECALDWTVKKLKTHLSDVYPSQPHEHQQRIIYSGKLLQDELQLKDVLRQYEPDQTTHTVHLVCSVPEYMTSQPAAPQPSTTEHNHTMSTEATNTEGVRHRRPNNDVTATTSTTTSTPASAAFTPQTFDQNPADLNRHLPGAAPFNTGPFAYANNMAMPPSAATMFPGMAYSPEQMLWLQQMYVQQMAHYMQYYQQVPVPTSPAPDITDQQPPHQAPPNVQPANQPAAPERNQPMMMNAAGEAVMDDDDEENANRDWLDWMYTFSRFGVLLSIVYFYSTFSRFLMVLGVFLFLYLYQAGWFMLRRDGNNRNQQPQRNGQENAQNAENARREGANNENEGDSVEDSSNETDTPEPEETVTGPGLFRVTWSFVSTFFTSLIPQPPPPVNIN